MADELAVGDRVLWRGGFGSSPPREAVVRAIERLPNGNPDDGEPVTSVSWAEFKSTPRGYYVELASGPWAYADQIEPLA